MTEFERMQAFSYLDGAAAGLKEARNDVIEELEKIKAEIDDLDRHFDNDYFSGNKESMFKCKEVFEILDKRISELKGEAE